MAGGWYHITDSEGRLASPAVVRDMLENWGDIHEAIDQLYGMVQWLAEQWAQQNPGNLTRHEAIEAALEHSREGIGIGREPSV
jgi:hypothetical protein